MRAARAQITRALSGDSFAKSSERKKGFQTPNDSGLSRCAAA